MSAVAEPEKVQSNFLLVLHLDGRGSHYVEVAAHRLLREDLVVIAFRAIARAPRPPRQHALRGPVQASGGHLTNRCAAANLCPVIGVARLYWNSTA